VPDRTEVRPPEPYDWAKDPDASLTDPTGRRPVPPLYDWAQDPDGELIDLTGRSARVTDRKGGTGRTTARRRRWPRRLLIGLAALLLVGLVIGLLLGFGTYPWQVETVPAAAVPTLTGRPIDEAKAAADANGWTLQRTDEHVEGSTAGQVLWQDPTPGTPLQRGMVLRVRVSLGPPLVEVPQDLAGKPLDQAQLALFYNGLAIGEVQRQPSYDAPADTVLSLAPGTPALVPKGSGVNLVVSSGPPRKPVPGLAGQRQNDASRQLRALGFEVEVEQESSDTVDRGRVLYTKPGAGAEVVEGGTVVIVVSQGSRSTGSTAPAGNGDGDGDNERDETTTTTTADDE
jgi:beta-lactam-binding protein with PASTA domain